MRSKIPLESWHLPYLEARPSPIHGLGVFTNKAIKGGEIVIVWGGIVISLEEFKAGKGLAHTNVGIGEGLFLASTREMTIDDYMNHSCDPNLWLIDEITLVVRRDIYSDDELTIDYSIELPDESYVMKHTCNCQSAGCRTRITGRDWRRKDIQERYEGHFSPFLTKRIKHLKSIHTSLEE